MVTEEATDKVQFDLVRLQVDPAEMSQHQVVSSLAVTIGKASCRRATAGLANASASALQ